MHYEMHTNKILRHLGLAGVAIIILYVFLIKNCLLNKDILSICALLTDVKLEHSTNTLDHTCSITHTKEEKIVHWFSLMGDSFQHLIS